jgi:peptidoglycan hydrolase-like protein with peptidoglycan-binding domain/SH3-like domain-containing protein
MRTRLQRILSILLGMILAISSMATVSAAVTYPYDVQSADSVNLRKYASSSSTVLDYIQRGDTLTLLGESGSYYKVQFGDVVGYAMKQYVDGVSLQDDPESITRNLSDITEYPYQTTTTDRVKLRSKADETASVILVVPQGDTITVSSVTSNGFAKVTYGGKTGYAMTEYINLAPIPTPTPVPEPTVDPKAAKYPTLKFGDTGTFVTALQEALTELRYYKSTVDGKYGVGTQTAVTVFEKKNKLAEDGVADPDLLYLLFEGTPRNYGGYKKDVKTVPPIYGISLVYGDKGEPVKQLQTRLQALGYFKDEISGLFNRATQSALKAFQKKMDINNDGVATPDVQTILYSAAAVSAGDTVTPTPAVTPTVAPPTVAARLGDEGEDVTKVQTRLHYLGYYSGKLDGKFGAGTKQAVASFQTKNNLTSDGICGTETIKALFSDKAAFNGATPTATPQATSKVVITEDTATIQSGSIGVAVLNLQRRLFELGYYVSRLDGVYLDEDMNAIKLFQRVNGLTADGKAGYETQKLLFSVSAKAAPADARTEEEASQYATLRYGDTSTEVTTMQNRLIALGYLQGEADGTFGLKTKEAIVRFQRENGLVRDGVAGGKTLATMYSDSAADNTIDTTVTLSMGTVSATVRKMQEHLISLGFLKGNADGVFGTATTLALIEFQKDQKLTANGIAGSLTLSALNKLLKKQEEEKIAAVAPNVNGTIDPARVKYANWYTEIRPVARIYPNVAVYDYNTGIGWHITLFSFGAHADGYPSTAEDTAKMNMAFGNVTTWTPKPVWVAFSNGSVYMASTHNTPHGVIPSATNNFAGHLCIHFPRTPDELAAIGPYATSHQKAIDLGWTATVAMAAAQ